MLIKTESDFTLRSDGLPYVQFVRFEGAPGDYDSIAKKICLAWIVNEI